MYIAYCDLIKITQQLAKITLNSCLKEIVFAKIQNTIHLIRWGDKV